MPKPDFALVNQSWSDEEVAKWERDLEKKARANGWDRLEGLVKAGCDRRYLAEGMLALKASQTWRSLPRTELVKARDGFLAALEALQVLAHSEFAILFDLHKRWRNRDSNVEKLGSALQTLEVMLEHYVSRGASKRRAVIEGRLLSQIAAHVRLKTGQGHLETLAELIGAVLGQSEFDLNSRLHRAEKRRRKEAEESAERWKNLTFKKRGSLPEKRP